MSFSGILWLQELIYNLGFVDENGKFTDAVPSKTHSQGVATTLVAALDPNISDRSGAYLADCKVDHEDMYADWAKNRGDAERLWKLSEQLVGQEFKY